MRTSTWEQRERPILAAVADIPRGQGDSHRVALVTHLDHAEVVESLHDLIESEYRGGRRRPYRAD